jgi:hypothetical protein
MRRLVETEAGAGDFGAIGVFSARGRTGDLPGE